MANISGVFSNASSGRLRVTLSATFKQGGNSRDAGFPSGSNDMLLAGIVNGIAIPAIARNTPTSVGEFDYPGENAIWTIQTYVLALSGGGVQAWGFVNVQMIVQLLKK